MSVLADYLRRRRESERGSESERTAPDRVTLKHAGLAVVVAVLGAAAVRRLRRRRAEPASEGDGTTDGAA